MSLWRRIVVLVVMASVMAFMSAPAAWAGGYDDDHDNGDDKDKKVCVKHYKGDGKYKYLYISYEDWKNDHKDHDKDKKVDDKYCDDKDNDDKDNDDKDNDDKDDDDKH